MRRMMREHNTFYLTHGDKLVKRKLLKTVTQRGKKMKKEN